MVKRLKKTGLCVCVCSSIANQTLQWTCLNVYTNAQPNKQTNQVFCPLETYVTVMVLIWTEFRIVPHFKLSIRKTWNYEEILSLLLVVLPLASLSCTFHTLRHQLVIHDDTTGKSWSVTKRNTTVYQLKSNILPSHSTASVKIYFHRRLEKNNTVMSWCQ